MVNKPIDTKKLDSSLTLLTGAGRIDSASYGLINSGKEVGLGITLNESSTSPPMIQAAFIIDGSEPDNVTYTLGGRVTFLDIGGYGSEWRTDFEIGNTYGIASEYYKRFNPHTKWFFAPAVDVSDRGEWIYSYNTPKADYRVIDAGGALDLGYAVNRFAEVRGGYEIGDLNYSLKLGTPEFSSIRGEVRAARFRFITDHRDDPIIPRVGYFGRADFHWVAMSPGAPAAFPNLLMKADFFKRVSDPGSVFLLASGGTTMGYEQTGIPQYLVGGVDGWLAYGSNELRGNQYFLFRMGYEHRIFKLPPFIGTGVYGIAMYEIGKMYNDPGSSALPNDGAAGILARTAFGPLFIGGSVGDTGHAKWFFNLGHVF
jgi:NTE family protein